MVLISGRLAAERVHRRRRVGRGGDEIRARERELDAAGITGAALRASYARCRALNARTAARTTWPRCCCRAARRPLRPRAVRIRPHVDDIVDDLVDDRSTTSADCPSSAGASDGPGRLWNGRDAARSGPPRGARHHRAVGTIPLSYFADFLDSMRMDLTVTEYATYDDLHSLHVGLGGGDRPADAADPRSGRRRSRGTSLEPRAIELGPRVPADQLHPRRRARTCAAGGSTCRRSRCDLFGVDRDRLAPRARGESTSRSATCSRGRSNAPAGSTGRRRPGIELVHPTSRDCLRTAFDALRGILDEIERADYDVFSGRVIGPVAPPTARCGPGPPSTPGGSGRGVGRPAGARASTEPHPRRQREQHQGEPEQQVLDRRVDDPPSDDRVGSYRTTGSPVSTPFTISWKTSTIAYVVQNAFRRSRFVRSTRPIDQRDRRDAEQGQARVGHGSGSARRRPASAGDVPRTASRVSTAQVGTTRKNSSSSSGRRPGRRAPISQRGRRTTGGADRVHVPTAEDDHRREQRPAAAAATARRPACRTASSSGRRREQAAASSAR